MTEFLSLSGPTAAPTTPATPTAPTTPALRWDRSVPRALVHRRSIAEVLLTDGHALGEESFLLAAQWSRSHPTFRPDGDGRHDPMLIVETLRQIGLYVGHRFLRTPPESRAVIKNIGFRVYDGAEPVVGHGATDVVCRTDVFDVRRTPGLPGPVSFSLRTEFRADGRPFGTAEGRVRVLTGAEYAALRGPYAFGAPVPDGRLRRISPAEAGVRTPEEVMLAREPGDLSGDSSGDPSGNLPGDPSGNPSGALLLSPADLHHPLYFDHPSDHVPGMVLLEAARQAVNAVHSRASCEPSKVGRLSECLLSATRFTEWDRPVHIEAVPCVTGGPGLPGAPGVPGDGPEADGRWSFRVVQGGTETTSGTLRFAST
ncbi:ScbA/BarX family gamma-butyrolactone biosynthesis protein [Streptomyces geranii]|uniref:ScbA/BarX family gamma-butyrolactone biosynthesis protein n=1 Tax=Streptomyces geranii TaxID=2058923 RepID=UPI000D026E07|nr:ScbA/BarX family gamma-butyrolactone biosynthesis protein [Streptomyces geranii]